MKKITATLLAMIALICAKTTNAQWSLTGNSNAISTSLLGTTNSVPLRLATKNTPRLVIDTLGRVGIGTTNPVNILSVKGSGGTPAPAWVNSGNPLFTGFGEQTVGNADYVLSMASSLANARPVFIGRKSKGTLAAPTVVANNDYLMSFLSSGYDGSSFQNGAAIDFYADGTPSAGNVPTRISFVTGSNSGNRAERLKIGNTGNVSINNKQFFVEQSTGNIGVGNNLPLAKMDIVGNIKIADGTQGGGKVLTSDSNGMASWQSIPVVTETDPEVSSSVTNTIPKWNGTTLVDGTIVDNGNVGIGEPNPQGILHVSQSSAFAGVTFTGTGVNDLSVDNSSYNLTKTTHFVIRVQDGSVEPNLIQISSDSGATFGTVFAIPLTPLNMAGQAKATFDSTVGHVTGDQWTWSVGPYFKNILVAKNGRVGIGTANPLAKLDVRDSSVLFYAGGAATINPSNIPVTNNNRQMLWYADKGAFRAGYTYYNAWTKDSIGNYSFATGSATVARGENSTAIGKETVAGGFSSSASGFGTAASGSFSNAMGFRTQANGENSTSMGNYTIANGQNSIATGNYTKASGEVSTSFGYYTHAKPYASLVIGQYNDTTAASTTSWVGADPVFIVGNGPSFGNRSNALTVLKNGRMGLGTAAPAYQLQLSSNSAAKPTSNTWTVASDSRLKTNVKDYTESLETLKKIHPVWFTYNGKAGMPKETGVGVIAQELQEVAPYMVGNWSYKDKENHTTEYLGVDNGAMTYMLINAVKELSTKVEQLEAKLSTSNSKTTSTISEQNVSFAEVSLSQNMPNPPVNNFTKINYSISNGAAKAEMVITDNIGRTIKQIALNNFGKGTLNVDTKGLSSGTYTYTLFVDGKMIASKKMVVAGN